MKKEIKKIVLVGIVGIFASAGLFGVVENKDGKTVESTAVRKAKDSPVFNDKLIKKIDIINSSDYDVKLFFSEQKPGKTKIKQQSIKVDKRSKDNKSVEHFGDGKIITGIQYVVYLDGDASLPMQVNLPGENSESRSTDLLIPQKVVIDVKRAFAAKDKILNINIRNAESGDRSTEVQGSERAEQKGITKPVSR